MTNDSNTNENTRREFIRKTITGVAAISFGGVLPGFSAKSYASILGANDRVKVAMMGVNARGLSLAESFAAQKNCQIIAVSDVDSRAAAKCIASVTKIQESQPEAIPDFRKALERKDLDALVVAAPDHWHAPAAILAAKAGKHVYLEKPCSHNPKEGELLLAARDKYKTVMQMGNQRRSYPNVAAAIKELHGGTIGRVYFSKAWYSNNRKPIGRGKQIQVPEWLDFELWQGPAPRKQYKDNLVHYNWHWFWHWGTGELANNGLHMLDLARWGMNVGYPVRVTSSGGRYHYQDDWETPDTQVVSFEFPDNKAATWEGRSCNGRHVEGESVGVIFYGEKGSLEINGDSYTIHGLDNKLLKSVEHKKVVTTGGSANSMRLLDAIHIQNFFDGIRKNTPLTSDILSGHQSTLLCQLGNIAQRSGAALQIDSSSGRILNNKKAMKYWGREYQPGWEPKV